MNTRSATSSLLTRRTLLRGLAATTLVGFGGSTLASCASPGSAGGPTSGGGKGPVTMGSYNSNPGVKDSQQALIDAASKSTGLDINLNLVDHETFKSSISNYLQATPDDLFTWFAGFRMQFFAAQGLATPIDDVWDKVGSNFGPAAKALSKGLDGKYYFIPMYNYPWVFFHNKSAFEKGGYAVPNSWDELITLCKRVQSDGLIPIAFADKDLWPACGFFDTIDLRLNGYDYHMKLMRHEVPWTDPGVTATFEQYAELLPYCQTGANGRIWQDAAKALENKEAVMMFQGSNQVGANYSPENLPDLDFFEFPAINSKYGTDYMEAPADGYMCSAKAKNPDAAKKVLEYLGTGAAAAKFLETDKWDVGMTKDADTSNYTELQKKSATLISSKKAVSQFLDRDTDPAMAAAAFSGLQDFIQDPSKSNILAIQKRLEDQAKTIFA
ncbi:ABC transporter substrate-binding protein [Rathayibacter soli]|uniref:ABC transporter substrate-binding protein n=1 Tax=Rathayibacter soli TaxID=3144168 RepID=UPI0027E3DF47|nr:extracellular solute-binding protein [Glaciibacter superstes]